jgi:hypothetical protein
LILFFKIKINRSQPAAAPKGTRETIKTSCALCAGATSRRIELGYGLGAVEVTDFSVITELPGQEDPLDALPDDDTAQSS